MATLPTVSGSENTWGTTLNQYLRMGMGHVANLTASISATGATAIYCVPANTKFVPTQCLIRSSLAITDAEVVNIGVSAVINSFAAARSISTLLGGSVAVLIQPSVALTVEALHILSATESLFISVPTANLVSGSYLTIDVYGVLIT